MGCKKATVCVYISSVQDKSFPQTPADNVDQTWTPSWWSSCDDTTDEECFNKKCSSVVDAFNNAMKELSEVASVEAPASITFQLNSSLDRVTSSQKASEACKMICQIIAPNAGHMLYQSLSQEENLSKELIALTTAYAKAPTRNLKTQILSIYAFKYPVKKLQSLHEPYAKLSKWQIKRARAHSRLAGLGAEVTQTK